MNACTGVRAPSPVLSKVPQVHGPYALTDLIPVQRVAESLPCVVFLLTRYSRDPFVNLVSGSSFDVGTRLRFWTDHVEVSRAYDLDGSRVALIDKSGFHDTAQNESRNPSDDRCLHQGLASNGQTIPPSAFDPVKYPRSYRSGSHTQARAR